MADLEEAMRLSRGGASALAVALVSVLVLTAASAAIPARGPASGRPTRSSVAEDGGAVLVAPAYVAPAGVQDLGPLGPTASVTVDIGLRSQDTEGLWSYVNATEVPGTEAFHRFLGPAEAAARFGALPSSVAAAESYFGSFGLSTTANPDGLLLAVSGAAPAVGRAFGTTLDLYRDRSGREYFSHPTAATLPAIVPWTGVYGLANESSFAPQVRASTSGPAGAPAAGCPGNPHGLTPCEVATAYDYAGLEASGTNGTHRTVAVIDAYSSRAPQTTLASDFAEFTQNQGLPRGNLSFLYPVPTHADLNASGTNPTWWVEDALDIEWVRGAAPGAAIKMVFSPNAGSGLYFAVDWVVAEKVADVISMSWSEPEVGVVNTSYQPCSSECNASSDGSFDVLGPVLELAAAEGISVFAASGDCGAADGTSGVAVSFPASDPFVTGVGGTVLTAGAGGTYVSETAWSGNSSGAKPPGCNNQGGSGGGFSILPRPYWQTGTGTVAARGRGVPDVAMVGGNPMIVWIRGTSGGYGSYDGTSLSTPIWAGLAATADQKAGSDLGLLDPSFYRILASPGYTENFHDIVTGSNGYSAGVGWDPVTGIGTPIVARLLPNLTAGAAAVSGLATDVYASPRFGPAPLTVQLAVTVRGGSAPYALVGVAFGDGTSASVAGGRTSHTFSRPGVYSVQSYVVDATGSTAASPPVVVVVGGGGPLSVVLEASSSTPATGAPVTFTAQVSGGTAPYLYNFSFGDGSYAENLSTGTAPHTFAVTGGFCAEVVVRDTHKPVDGGASARIAIAVGGAGAPSCGNPAEPLKLIPNATVGVRDAPADFPSLFTATGGATAPSGIGPQLGLSSEDAYTAACGCAILRSAGTYTVEEWENDTVNDEASAEVNLTVAPPLDATFRASTLVGDAPLTVTFSAVASGGYFASAAETHWSFGNGQARTGAEVQATYTAPAEYVAIASLSDRGQGNASEAFLVDVENAASPGVGVAGTVTPAVNVSSGTTVSWNATAVGPASARAGSFLGWDLGNGATAFGPTANETYFSDVDLLAGDTLAASVSVDTAYLGTLVQVPISLDGFFATEAGGFVPAVDALELDTEVYPSAGFIPLAITGSASASGPGGTAVGWLFGDGGSASGLSVEHTFYGSGEFTVTVRGYDGFGDTAERLSGVAATPALSLSGCGAGTRRGTAPYTVDLAPDAFGGAGPPYSYLWKLPNGTTSTATSVELTFGSPGTYHVSVVVTDSESAETECAWSIVVGSVPPVLPLDIVAFGAAAGVVLVGVFLYATRPRPSR